MKKKFKDLKPGDLIPEIKSLGNDDIWTGVTLVISCVRPSIQRKSVKIFSGISIIPVANSIEFTFFNTRRGVKMIPIPDDLDIHPDVVDLIRSCD